MIGEAALAIWFEVGPDGLEDTNAWYPRQHLPERLSVPGFLRGRRYQVVGEGPTYFTLYELADGAVATSPAYLERLNHPTDWTRRVLPTWSRMIRNPYRRLATGVRDRWERHLMPVRIAPAAGRPEALGEWLGREAGAALDALAGVSAWATYASDTGGAAVQTEERRLVRAEVQPATPFLAVCELAEPGVAGALREFWRAWGARHGATVTTDVYALLYGLGWLRP